MGFGKYNHMDMHRQALIDPDELLEKLEMSRSVTGDGHKQARQALPPRPILTGFPLGMLRNASGEFSNGVIHIRFPKRTRKWSFVCYGYLVTKVVPACPYRTIR